MHVVWINRYASLIGGCERYCTRTASALREMGVRSTLLYDPLEETEGELLAAFDEAFPAVDWQEQLRTLDPDVIYVHQLDDPAAFEALALQPAPVLRFFHDHDLFYKTKVPGTRFRGPTGGYGLPAFGFISKQGIRTRWQYERQLKLQHALDAYVVGSDYMADLLKEHGLPEHKIYTHPLYVPGCERVDVPRERDLIACVGSLTRGKGVDRLLDAVALLQVPWRLAIAGEGPQEGDLRRQVERLGLTDRVEFLGKLSEHELPELYARSACLAMSQRLPETFGLVGLEAMQQETPAVAVDLGAVSTWLHHEHNGILVPPGDSHLLAIALERILTEPKLRDRLGKQGADAVARQYRGKRHARELLSTFENLQTGTHFSRLTAKGSDSVEEKLQQILKDVRDVVIECHGDQLVALILFGGYGKGEGGVQVKDGAERPHNNLDFLIVTRDSQPELKTYLDQKLQPIRDAHALGIDISVMTERRVRKAPPLVLWYDMVGGHRTIAGNTDLLRKHPAGRLERLDAKDVHRLLVNRGALLVINDCMLEKPLSDKQRSAVIRHGVKAVIGYGDALLYVLGEYHWSYQKKRMRMRRRPDISEEFKQLYDEASGYRLQPKPELFAERDLKAWNEELKRQLGEVYLRCYELHPRGVAIRGRDRLDALFPEVCFEKTRGPRDFLQMWGRVADDNFGRVAEELGIELEESQG